jgi:hypothetical protein
MQEEPDVRENIKARPGSYGAPAFFAPGPVPTPIHHRPNILLCPHKSPHNTRRSDKCLSGSWPVQDRGLAARTDHQPPHHVGYERYDDNDEEYLYCSQVHGHIMH